MGVRLTPRKETSFWAECAAQAVGERIRNAVRTRVAIARAKREVDNFDREYQYTSGEIYKEDVAITEPERELDSHASQRGCQDGGTRPSSSAN